MTVSSFRVDGPQTTQKYHYLAAFMHTAEARTVVTTQYALLNRCGRLARCDFLFCIALAVLGTLHSTARADWPEYRGNAQRTGVRLQQKMPGEWRPAWFATSLSSPQRAWPDPARRSLWQNLDHIEPRVSEDRGHVPLIARNGNSRWCVIVSSATDNRLDCYDAKNGEMIWSHYTRAPVRYAPTIHDGRVLFGGDDGFVRSLDIDTGHIQWETRIGPDLPWIFGNGRLINPHPIRTSVLVETNHCFANAGLFPSQGVYSAALDLNDGSLIWRRRIDRSPQGYLLSDFDSRRFFVPSGRAKPFMVSMKDGEILGDLPSPGGAFCMATPDAFFSGPGNAKQVASYSREDNSMMLTFGGNRIAAGRGRVWIADGKTLRCEPLDNLKSTDARANHWSVRQSLDGDLCVAGTETQPQIFLAGRDQVLILDALTGDPLHHLQLSDFVGAESDHGDIEYIAVCGETDQQTLVVSTNQGRLYAWTGAEDSKRSDESSAIQVSSAHLRTAAEEPIVDPNSGSQTRAADRMRADRFVVKVVDLLPDRHGLAVIIGNAPRNLIQSILANSELTGVWITNEPESARKTLRTMATQGLASNRFVVWDELQEARFPITNRLVNLVLHDGSTEIPALEFRRVIDDAAGVIANYRTEEVDTSKPQAQRGSWRHQYGEVNNVASVVDPRVGSAVGFKLQWFGGVGPRRLPDRHLRGPAPLAAGSSMVIHGDGVLIGVDPANGIERWELDLPDNAMRYVMPFDAGYSSLSRDGRRLWVAADREIWKVDANRGDILQRLGTEHFSDQLRCGYLAEIDGDLIASCMRSSAARRELAPQAARRNYSDQDYRSERPLVCSRQLVRLSPEGQTRWKHTSLGPIVHSSISIDLETQALVWLEGRSQQCQEHATDRVPLNQIMADAFLVCCDLETGEVRWQVPFEWVNARNAIYLQLHRSKISVVTSASVDGKAIYAARVLSQENGQKLWETDHSHIKSGLYHGEQVQHPVITQGLGNRSLLVVEPYIYDFDTGEKLAPMGEDPQWALQRPGHSCGTLTGAGNCLFFRASNPTFMNLTAKRQDRFIKLSPSRPSCWINMIPATGRLLIPEGSASCVCDYPLQTSMGFLPMNSTEGNGSTFWLPDIVPE